MAAPGALCAALVRKQLASTLPCCDARTSPGNQGEEMENDQPSTWKQYDREYKEEDVVKDYVSTGRTLTTRNPAGRCTRTETSLG